MRLHRPSSALRKHDERSTINDICPRLLDPSTASRKRTTQTSTPPTPPPHPCSPSSPNLTPCSPTLRAAPHTIATSSASIDSPHPQQLSREVATPAPKQAAALPQVSPDVAQPSEARHPVSTEVADGAHKARNDSAHTTNQRETMAPTPHRHILKTTVPSTQTQTAQRIDMQAWVPAPTLSPMLFHATHRISTRVPINVRRRGRM